MSSVNNGVYTITLFNNDNNRPPQSVNASTGLELLVNTNTMRASLSRKLNDPTDLLPAQAQGSYQDIGHNHVIVGYGSIPVIKEFDGSNDVVMTAAFGNHNNNGVKGYRSYRYAWTGTPFYAPKVVARISSGTTDVYMSWNGATDITGWNIYTADTKAGLKKLTTVSRTGFETHAHFKNKRKFLQVEAVRSGVAVRKSAIIKPTVA